MNTKQIVYNSKGAANAVLISLEAQLKHLHTGYTTEYSYVIKHPTEDKKWAVRFNMSGIYWELVEDHLNPHQLGELEEITEDWIVKEEF